MWICLRVSRYRDGNEARHSSLMTGLPTMNVTLPGVP